MAVAGSVYRKVSAACFLLHMKLRPIKQKSSGRCTLGQRRSMSQATAPGARMFQGTFFVEDIRSFKAPVMKNAARGRARDRIRQDPSAGLWNIGENGAYDKIDT